MAGISCQDPGPFGNGPLRMEKPEKVLYMDCDRTFVHVFPEVLQCTDLQIVADSVLVCQDYVGENNGDFFKTYSLRTFRFLGSFGRKGRGPNEFLFPNMTRGNPDAEVLYLNDNPMERVYEIDVLGALRGDPDFVIRTGRLPDGVADWMPLTGTSCLNLKPTPQEFVLQYADWEGNVRKAFSLYTDAATDLAPVQLSSVLVSNGKTGQAAILMVCFPQLLLTSPEGEIFRAVAVDKAARKWKVILENPFGMDAMQYYSGAAATKDHIIASYRGLSLGDVLEGGHGGSVQIFDWDGNYRYEVRIAEDIGPIAFDSVSRYLYALERGSGRIVRYDFSGILAASE